MAKPVRIELVVDSTGAVRGLRDAEGRVAMFGDETDRTGERVSRFGRTVDVALGNIAAKAAERLVQALRGAIRQGRDLLALSSDMAETGSAFDTVFGRGREAVQGFIDDWANMAGLTSRGAQDLIRVTGSIADGLGFAEDARAELSVGIAELAGDLASFDNRDIRQVMEALNAAIVGNTESMRSMGIVITQEEVRQKAVALGLARTTTEVSAQARAMATYELAVEKAGVAVGDLERTQDSAANKGRRARAQFNELVETFSRELLPAATELNGALADLSGNEEVAEWAREAGQAISRVLVRGIELAVEFIELLARHRQGIAITAEAVVRLSIGIGAYVVATRAAILWTRRFALVTQAAAIAQRALNFVMRANPIGLVIAALAVIIPLVLRFRSEIRRATADILDFAADTSEGLQQLVSRISGMLSALPEAARRLVPGLAMVTAGLAGAERAAGAAAGGLRRNASELRNSADEADAAAAAAEGVTEAVEDQTDALKDNTEETKRNAEAKKNLAERERELRRMGIEVMEDGVQKTLAAIDADFDERERRMQERYGDLTEKEAKLLRIARSRAVAEAFNALVTDDLPEIEFKTRFTFDDIKRDADEVKRALDAGLLLSLRTIEEAIQDVDEEFRNATNDQRREEIRAIRDELEAKRKTMVEVQKAGIDLGEAMAGISRAAQDMAHVFGSSFDLMVSRSAEAYERMGMSREEALAQAQKDHEKHLVNYKRFATIAALADTYAAANAAYKAMAGIPVVGPALGAAAAAAAVAAGLANVRMINAQGGTAQSRTDAVSEARGSSRGIQARARGGNVFSGQPYLVGEEGPEIIMPRLSGTVLPANVSRVLRAAGGTHGAVPASGASAPEVRSEFRVHSVEVETRLETLRLDLLEEQRIANKRGGAR